MQRHAGGHLGILHTDHFSGTGGCRPPVGCLIGQASNRAAQREATQKMRYSILSR